MRVTSPRFCSSVTPRNSTTFSVSQGKFQFYVIKLFTCIAYGVGEMKPLCTLPFRSSQSLLVMCAKAANAPRVNCENQFK